MTPLIESATARLLATADALPDGDWSAPSVCDGWSRAHVLAHVALNAEALAGVLRGLAGREAVPMYVSDEGRDSDIATLAAAPPDEVRARLRSSSTAFVAALADLGVADVPDGAQFERTPGGQRMDADVVPLLRLREVEIHHADLDAGYTHAHWPRDSAIEFLDLYGRNPMRPDCRVVASDGDELWVFGTPDPDAEVVRGPATALAWWASGRGMMEP